MAFQGKLGDLMRCFLYTHPYVTDTRQVNIFSISTIGHEWGTLFLFDIVFLDQ